MEVKIKMPFRCPNCGATYLMHGTGPGSVSKCVKCGWVEGQDYYYPEEEEY